VCVCDSAVTHARLPAGYAVRAASVAPTSAVSRAVSAVVGFHRDVKRCISCCVSAVVVGFHRDVERCISCCVSAVVGFHRDVERCISCCVSVVVGFHCDVERCISCCGSGRLFRTDLHGKRHVDSCWHCHGTGHKRYVTRGVRRMTEVNARRARLVPGWMTVFGRVYHLGM